MTSIPETFALAVRYHRAGQFAEAEPLYRAILARDPQHAEAWHLLGLSCYHTGRAEAAIDCLHRALAVDPANASYHLNLGNVLRERGVLDEAAASYRRSVELMPTSVVGLCNLGLLCRELGRLEESATCFRRVLELDPNRAEIHCELGFVLVDQGHLDEAVASFRRAVQLRPTWAVAHNDLGHALEQLGKLDEAIACYQRALQLNPDDAYAHNNLGAALQTQGKPDEAVACYRRASLLNPDDAAAQTNLGLAFADQGRMDDALACYRRALQLQPDCASARLYQSFAWLLTGDFDRGWPAYEWRWKVKPLKGLEPQLPQPRWDGLTGTQDAVLLLAEQGLGDTLQFIRYARLVRQRCRELFFSSPRSLAPILSRTPGIDRLITELSTAPPFDAQSPLVSVPGILGTRLESIPAEVPYLFADPELVTYWRHRLQDVPGLRIGINWRGRPGPGPWCRRDLPLQLFSTLAALPHVQLISLQKGATGDELAVARKQFPLLDFGDDLDESHGAFMDSAAIMMNLDLVITSDTAVPHLAGGLGVPVWVALPFAPDWRWLLRRSDSPWYPTMRLFRQPAAGDWDSVFQAIAQALGERLGERPA